jgi:CPA2 family monovalent cation:H+ antiporter-2
VDLPIPFVAGGVFLLLFLTGYFSFKIKIPSVVFYIVIGISTSSLFTDNHLLHLSGQIGIILLFFLLGMEFPLHKLSTVAKKVASAGILDVFLSFIITFIICLFFKLGFTISFLIAGVVYATSSSITAKLLESSKRIANPESEFILGLLIFEDLVAPIIVAILVGLTTGNGVGFFDIILLIFKIIVLTIGAIFIGRLLFKKSGSFIDKYISSDLFILFVIGIALAYGGLALFLNLSEVLGAFLAGMMIAEANRTEQIEQLIIPFRDLLIPLFFLYFGTTILLNKGVPYLGFLIVILIWSILSKILTGFYGGKMYGLSNRVALRAGLSMTSRGEFSVIIATLASSSYKVFSGIFILISAMIGIVLFSYAPRISKAFFNKKKSKKPQ